MKCENCPFFKPSANQLKIGKCQQHQEMVRSCDNACTNLTTND